MKLVSFLALLALIEIVRGTWWAAAIQPVILSLGTVLTAINQDVLDINSIEWKNLQIFKNEKEEQKEEKKEK